MSGDDHWSPTLDSVSLTSEKRKSWLPRYVKLAQRHDGIEEGSSQFCIYVGHATPTVIQRSKQTWRAQMDLGC
jgi:hypothetical protein